MATSVRHRLEQAEALVAEKQANYEKEMASMRSELKKGRRHVHQAKAQPEKWSTPKKLAELKGKKPFLQMKLDALQKAADEAMAAQTKLRDLLNEDIRDYYQKMRGLLSYGIATGRTNPDCKLLFDSLGDYLDAKSESDRKAAKKAVNLCLAHGNFDSTDRVSIADDADARILTQFEAISDPEEQSRFYAKHKKEIVAAFEARKNSQS